MDGTQLCDLSLSLILSHALSCPMEATIYVDPGKSAVQFGGRHRELDLSIHQQHAYVKHPISLIQ